MERIIVMTPSELETYILGAVRKALTECDKSSQEPRADRLLNIKEAGAFLNLKIQTLYGFTSKRLIPFIKRAKKLYFRQSELETWLNAGKKKSIDEITKEIEQP